jgi:hypothetical protein
VLCGRESEERTLLRRTQLARVFPTLGEHVSCFRVRLTTQVYTANEAELFCSFIPSCRSE